MEEIRLRIEGKDTNSRPHLHGIKTEIKKKKEKNYYYCRKITCIVIFHTCIKCDWSTWFIQSMWLRPNLLEFSFSSCVVHSKHDIFKRIVFLSDVYHNSNCIRFTSQFRLNNFGALLEIILTINICADGYKATNSLPYWLETSLIPSCRRHVYLTIILKIPQKKLGF